MRFIIKSKQLANSIAVLLKKKVMSLKTPTFQEQCAGVYANMIEPYVPKKTGKLRNSYTIVNQGRYIRYNTDYAQKVYEIPARRYTTPGTTHHWDVVANPQIMARYQAVISQMIKEQMARN